MTSPTHAGLWERGRQNIEGAFEAWGRLVFRRPWWTIGVCMLAVGALSTQLSRIEVDTSNEGFLEPDDPARVVYDTFREQFGREEILFIAIRTSEVFSFRFLERLRALHEDLENELPHLEDVTSLINVRDTRGDGEELIVDDFLEHWPETSADLQVLRERGLAKPLYRDVILSADAMVTTIAVETSAFSSLAGVGEVLDGFEDPSTEDIPPEAAPVFITGEENTEVVRAAKEIAARHAGPDFEIHIAGMPILTDRVMGQMLSDMWRFTLISLIVMGAFLLWLFRSLVAVVLTLVTAFTSVICGFAFFGISGVPLTTATQITPSFLLAVGVGNSVHLLAIFLQERARGRDVGDALAYSLGHSGFAIVMTGFTTAGSLLSFQSAEVALVADFGTVAPGGVMITLALSLVLLPALIAVTPMRAKPVRDSLVRRIPAACGMIGTRYPGVVVAVWGTLFAVSVVGVFELRFSNYAMGWFQPDEPIRVATEIVDSRLGGANTIEMVVDSGRENGLYEPDLLRRIESLQHYIEAEKIGEDMIGKTTISIVEVTKEIHMALNGNRPEFYAIPDDRELIAQELLLFENSGTDDLEDVVDSQFRQSRISIKVPLVDSVHGPPLLDRIRAQAEATFGDVASFVLTGHFAISSQSITATIRSLSRTYLLAFAIITPFMMLLLGSLRTGLLSMIPAMGAMLITVGLMGWASIPMEVFSLLTGCIALGLAVDDTIHFMHGFARARRSGDDVATAVRVTLDSTGQALLFTSVVLSAGFLVYTQATLTLLFNFGFLTAFAIAMAFVANVTLAPALVTLVSRVSRGL
ncbi:MAG: MMPL family transporter [bacterium]|nr:hypothetical protein [Deltaproteobacteria bacterium]MCP4908807.1 MMPL family transporter [bacterium]